MLYTLSLFIRGACEEVEKILVNSISHSREDFSLTNSEAHEYKKHHVILSHQREKREVCVDFSRGQNEAGNRVEQIPFPSL